LLFGKDDVLDKQKITKRRKELAKLCHPDSGGSVEAMQAVNYAADVLLAKL
jgi:hypothetical protein